MQWLVARPPAGTTHACMRAHQELIFILQEVLYRQSTQLTTIPTKMDSFLLVTPRPSPSIVAPPTSAPLLQLVNLPAWLDDSKVPTFLPLLPSAAARDVTLPPAPETFFLATPLEMIRHEATRAVPTWCPHTPQSDTHAVVHVFSPHILPKLGRAVIKAGNANFQVLPAALPRKQRISGSTDG